jgi:hypothetical protein
LRQELGLGTLTTINNTQTILLLVTDTTILTRTYISTRRESKIAPRTTMKTKQGKRRRREHSHRPAP